jgi:hypothetical protein
MGKFSILIIFIGFLNASIIDDYKNKNYEKICTYKNVLTYRKNEKILSIIGDSCVKTDNLYLLPSIIANLKYTSIGRKNAIYFLTIFNEKRLLYSFLFDNFDISDFSFPQTEYILSVVFDAIKNGKYEKIDNIYLIKKDKFVLRIYKKNDKMIVEKMYKNILLERHWFK